jgi:hypothetical protein
MFAELVADLFASEQLDRRDTTMSDSRGVAQAGDERDLAAFGYRQELDRSLGAFSTFAAGFSYISILTGGFQLFFFAFAMAGPGFVWTWPVVVAGQMLFALCFADLAAHFPIAGSRHATTPCRAGA